MTNPYLNRPENSFWKPAVASKEWTELVPISNRIPLIQKGSSIAAAGSCFAQKVANYIKSNEAINFLELETVSAGQPVYSARYGNIYTTRQLLELVEEVIHGEADQSCAVRREDGRFVDVFRPFVIEEGFSSADAVIQSRTEHLDIVYKMFTEADVFVFTLGLTEAWISKETGRTFPVCPGIYTSEVDSKFVNYNFQTILSDLNKCIDKINSINPDLQVILTVSPVPLTATYTDQHVLEATTYSKSVLRTVCGEIISNYSHVHYFPSYEIVVNPYRNGCAFEDNKRAVKQDVVDVVMATFEHGFLEENIHIISSELIASASNVRPIKLPNDKAPAEDDPVCDDVKIEKSIGF